VLIDTEGAFFYSSRQIPARVFFRRETQLLIFSGTGGTPGTCFTNVN